MQNRPSTRHLGGSMATSVPRPFLHTISAYVTRLWRHRIGVATGGPSPQLLPRSHVKMPREIGIYREEPGLAGARAVRKSLLQYAIRGDGTEGRTA
jgi:hypothetical protein